ncbi:MAG: carbohydrate binding family 9 domain-containing protein, partial [Bacteroidetes bacterium]|nr:carbohydrate binding family 9 domain-containing protein [Bacteroidota bacterium]
MNNSSQYVRRKYHLIIIAFITVILPPAYPGTGQIIHKRIEPLRTDNRPVIDGSQEDECWLNAPVAKDFCQYEPVNLGTTDFRTEVKIVYDNSAIYFLAIMNDDSPDSIYTNLSPRDAFGSAMADHFVVNLSPFRDGKNAYEFWLSAAGVQSDLKMIPDGTDNSWNGVWKAACRITEEGWIAEFEIPYTDIRFTKADSQLWGINFWRSVRRRAQWDSWNPVNKETGNELIEMGELCNLRDIKPPLRLSFTPYISSYLLKEPEIEKTGYSFNGGMDLKYGINESFTLDMTLVPDFGQVQSDDKVLNLSPYETYYGEQRPFFTEGTELLSKLGIFYTRRVGAEPSGHNSAEEQLQDGETLTGNPDETRLINATKITGRTAKGTGLG